MLKGNNATKLVHEFPDKEFQRTEVFSQNHIASTECPEW